MNALRSVSGKIGIAAFCGSYWTGKSFALNMLLGKMGGKGFKVSPTTKSCTQGIWIWGWPVYVPSRDMHVFLLDTEGSGSTEWNLTHDAKIFALVVLLSSLFVYNSMGAIDERAINSLSLAAELSSNIAIWANKKLG